MVKEIYIDSAPILLVLYRFIWGQLQVPSEPANFISPPKDAYLCDMAVYKEYVQSKA